jgi:2-desacetyl-2-hydroxyethyl bacteriochlorophyllide A dehydrogenase
MAAMELQAFDEPLRAVRRDVPRPGPGEVLMRVEACGVCGSDVFLQKGGFARPLPIVPGHEAAGVVAEVGPGVEDWSVGEQAALYYISTPPGDRWAAAGHPNRSPAVVRMGVDVDGAFAEYVVRPVTSLVRPRAPLDPRILAVLTDAVGTPLHALKRVAEVQAGETVVVLGIGGIGSSAVQLARIYGARVVAVARSERKQELARTLGAEVVAADTPDIVEHIRGLTDGAGPDVVVQCVGSAAQDELAVALAGPGGRVVLVGSSTEPMRVRAVEICWRELRILGSRGFVPDDIADAIDLYLDGRLQTDHLLDRVRPLAEANEALDDLRAGRVLRSVLTP